MDGVQSARRIGITAALALALIGCFAGTAAAAPATFEVGTGVVDISPTTPQYPGGYGYKTGPTAVSNDPLQARAFVVTTEGKKAVAFVSVDSIGWFADYQDVNAGMGITDAREKAAGVLQSKGFTADRSSVIVSTTHGHATPTLVGIWGPVDPAYLKAVHDAAVQAVSVATDHLKTSQIWTATGNIRSMIWQNGQGTDHPDGFAVDEKTPILWARDPSTGATNGMYINVPVHADEYNGAFNVNFSADWPGYVRAKLDSAVGGTTVMAQGTLGRQETPGSDKTYSEVVHQGEFIANAIELAMANARPLESDTVASDESFLQTAADNDDLLLAMNLNAAFPNACIDSEKICTIPRSVDPPYLTGDTTIGTYVSTLRIGDVVYFTNPGEAFPEVNDAVRAAIGGARSANVVATAGDFLGYYYVRSDYTDEQFGSSDFEKYNVGPDLAQQNADLAIQNAAGLGFPTTPKAVHAEFNPTVANLPGIQFYPERVETANPAVPFYGATAKAQHAGTATGNISWDFGDGTTGTSANSERFVHNFPGPGTYPIVAAVTDANSGVRAWTQTVKIDSPLSASGSIASRRARTATLRVTTAGGQGTAIGAAWTCPDGSKVYGLRPTCPARGAGQATVVAVDGAGNEATTSVAIPAPAKLSIRLRRQVRRGRIVRVVAIVRNVGGVDATHVHVCAPKPRRRHPAIRVLGRCRLLGTIATSRTKRVVFRVRRRGPRARVVFIATANNGIGSHRRVGLPGFRRR